jgi:RNase P subunit RPR2
MNPAVKMSQLTIVSAILYGDLAHRFFVVDNDGSYSVSMATADGTVQENNVEGFPFGDNKSDVVTAFYRVAVEQGMEPEMVINIKNGTRVLQVPPMEVEDVIKLDDSARCEEIEKYLAAEKLISEIEEERDGDIKDAKSRAKEEIADQEEIMNRHRLAFEKGLKAETCKASWEKDLDAGIKVQIRHDTKKVMAVLPLEENGVDNQADLLQDQMMEAGDAEGEIDNGQETPEEETAPETDTGETADLVEEPVE